MGLFSTGMCNLNLEVLVKNSNPGNIVILASFFVLTIFNLTNAVLPSLEITKGVSVLSEIEIIFVSCVNLFVWSTFNNFTCSELKTESKIHVVSAIFSPIFKV